MKTILKIEMVIENDRDITLSVNDNKFCTYHLYVGEEPIKIATKAAIELRKFLHGYSSNEVYHSNTFIP